MRKELPLMLSVELDEPVLSTKRASVQAFLMVLYKHML
jgi:hypothetical protein